MTSTAETAKLIRKDLKSALPFVKFTVKSKRYSMGDSVWITYTGGPESQKVRDVVDKYQEGDFDGMTDSYIYRAKKEHPTVKFVQIQRSKE